MKRRKNRKITGIVLIIALLTAFFPFGSMRVQAEGPDNSEENSFELSSVRNLHLKGGSTATVAWDEVEDANYYAVVVNCVGESVSTGTSETELDVQQEIHHILEMVSRMYIWRLEPKEVTVSVVAQKKQDDVVVKQSLSEEVSFNYTLVKNEKLEDPTNVILTDDYMVQFETNVDNPGEVISGFLVYIDYKNIDEPEEPIDPDDISLFLDNENPEHFAGEHFGTVIPVDIQDGICQIDVREVLEKKYQEIRIDGQMKVSCSVCMTGYFNYNDSFDVWSNSVNYGTNEPKRIEKLPTVTSDILLTEDYYANFSTDFTNPLEYVQEVMFEFIYKDQDGRLWEYGKEFGASRHLFEGNDNHIYLKNILKDGYRQFEFDGEVDVAYRVTLIGTDDYYDSDPSEYSNFVKYSLNKPTVVAAPTNVLLTNDFVAQFNYNIPREDNLFNQVDVYVYYKSMDGCYGNMFSIEPINKNPQIDIKSTIINGYMEKGLEGAVEVAYKVRVCHYREEISYVTEFSELSNWVVFRGIRNIEALTLAPAKPIICQGRSYYLGKTITPEDAYYENINWSSEDENIVIVDEDGQITGVTPGTTNVTAAIGDVTATVPVTVYAISSNIEDPNDNEEVTNVAGEIIDDIANNDNPNLDDTDIDPENLEELKEEIYEAIENGDTFHTDVVAIQQYYEKYKSNWGQIQKATKYLNAQFEGAYNIEVEMYHKDQDNNNHHIGNITELDNEISFTFDLPTGMKEQQSGNTKKYVLVRVHKNSDGTMEYSPVDYEINDDGTFTARSDQYSDFIWCSVWDENDNEGDADLRLIDGRYLYYENGTQNTSYFGYIDFEGGKFLIVNGAVATNANGLKQDPNKKSDWYYCSHGQVQKRTGLVMYDKKWFYVNQGRLDTKYSGYVSYDGGLFFVGAGRIMTEVNGLAQDPNGTGWYFLANGQAQTKYTGLTKYDKAWFYVVDGKLAQNYTGFVSYNGADFYVVNGMLK